MNAYSGSVYGINVSPKPVIKQDIGRSRREPNFLESGPIKIP